MIVVPAVEVADWSPSIFVSDQVSDSAALAQFVERCGAGFVAPAIDFSGPRAVAIAGGRFATIDRDDGLQADSIHTLGRHDWHALFFGIRKIQLHPEIRPAPLLVGNSGSNAYYHWTLESVGSLLVQQAYDSEERAFVLPMMTERWKSESLALLGIDAELIEVAANELAAFDSVMTTNLTGRHYAFSPHPALLAELRGRALVPRGLPAPKRIYVARIDEPTRRPMVNEADVCDLVRAYGFEVIVPGQLPVAEQARLFRGAELIVAPHGAGLTNLVYAEDGAAGPRLIELIHDAYLARGYVKLAQAKGLSYCALINAGSTANYHHEAHWSCDLDLLERVLKQA